MKELAKKAMKRVAAVGMGTAMVAGTIAGAVAADLSNYPSPFVKDGVFNGEIVVGSGGTAAGLAADIVGAIDIAASLQYAMKTGSSGEGVSSEGGSVVVETGAAGVSGGAKIESTSTSLLLNANLASVDTKIDENELDLLEKGTLTDDSTNVDYDYEQEIIFGVGSPVVKFDRSQDTDVFDDPVLYLDMDVGPQAYNVTVDFSKVVNTTLLDDGEKLMIAGKEFSFKNIAVNDDIVIYSSDETVYIELGQSKTVTVAGKEYTVSMDGATETTAVIGVNGERKSVSENDNVRIGGLDLTVSDLFISNIGTETASASIFVGSDEIEFDSSGSATSGDVLLGGETLDGVTWAISGSEEALDKLTFLVDPSDMEDADEYVEKGKSFADPLFKTFEINFVGEYPELMSSSRDEISLSRSGKDAKLKFTNAKGVKYELTAFRYDGTSAVELYKVVQSKGFNGQIAAGTNIAKDDIFVLNEGDGATGAVTRVFEVNTVKTDSSVDKVELKDIGTGSVYLYKDGDQIGDTGAYVGNISVAGKTFRINSVATYTNSSDHKATASAIYARGDARVTIADDNDGKMLNISEDFFAKIKDDSTPAYFYLNATPDTSDSEINVNYLSGSASASVSDEDSDWAYVVTNYGTYGVIETDQKEKATFYYSPNQETTYSVYVSPTGAGSSAKTKSYSEGDVLSGIGTIKAITAGAVSGGAYNINKIKVPLAKLDSDATLGSTNQVIVGGPAVNRLAAEAAGVPYPTYGVNSGLLEGEGEAIIKLYEQGSNVAVLVAGWDAADTQRASAVLAQHDAYALEGTELKITGTLQSPKIELQAEKDAMMEEESMESES